MAFDDEIHATITIPLEQFAQRNDSLATLWGRFFSNHQRPDDEAQLCYVVQHLPTGHELKGTACLLSAIALGIAVKTPEIGTVIRRTCTVARALCSTPSPGQRFLGFSNAGIFFCQNNLEPMTADWGEYTTLDALLNDRVNDGVRQLLGLACGEELYRVLSEAAADEFQSYCLSIPDAEGEFAQIFEYCVFGNEGARLAHKHRVLNKKQRANLENREDCVHRAIQAADRYLVKRTDDLADR